MEHSKLYLTPEQKAEAIDLFTHGLRAYTKISAKMRVPYQAINSFMTKWKYKNGILVRPKKIARSKKKQRSPLIASDEVLVSKIVTEELKFLRDFYLKTADSVQAIMLKKQITIRKAV